MLNKKTNMTQTDYVAKWTEESLTEDCFSCNTRKGVQSKLLHFDSDITGERPDFVRKIK